MDVSEEEDGSKSYTLRDTATLYVGVFGVLENQGENQTEQWPNTNEW